MIAEILSDIHERFILPGGRHHVAAAPSASILTAGLPSKRA
jgi:hypothetical protein